MKKKLVLIVEDEEDVAKYLAAALSDQGFETLTASDAASGLELATQRRPDLICLDLVMPGRAGLSLYREMRQTPGLEGVPIVVVSGLVSADAAGKLGWDETLPLPDAFIEKPVNIPELVEAVRELVLA